MTTGLRLVAMGILCGVIVISGCATAQVDIHDENLTAESLVQGRIALAGVVSGSRVEGVSEEGERRVANQVAAALAKKRSNYEVMRLEEFRRVVPTRLSQKGSGSESHEQLSRWIDQASRTKAQKAGITHLLLIEVTGNDTKCWTEEDCDEETHYHYNEEGEVTGSHTEKTYTTYAKARRRVAAQFRLVNLSEDDARWVASSVHSGVASRSRCSDCCYPEPPAFPGVPSTEGVLGEMAWAAVKKLPKEKRGWFGGRAGR